MHNIACWNISNLNNVDDMFCRESPMLFHKNETMTFFEECFKNMEPSQRKKIFDKYFDWIRRKDFISFLFQNGYIQKNTK